MTAHAAVHPRQQLDAQRRLLLAALWLPLLLIVYAAWHDIVLFLDAAYYLYLNLLRQDFALLEPSSRTVQWLQQLPVVVLIRLQVENLALLKFFAGSWNLLLPLGLTALVYLVLPPEDKPYFVFPLAAYVAGALVSFFPTITDAPTAAAYFWLLLVLVLYAQRWRYGCWLTVLLSLPAMYLHESMVFLAPLLGVAVVLRWRHSQQPRQHWWYALLLLYFVLVTAVALQHIMEPRSLSNRSGFLSMLLNFRWYVWQDGSFNTAAMLSVTGLLLMFLFWLGWCFAPAQLQRHAFWLVLVPTLLYGLFAVLLLLLQAQGQIDYSIFAQFAARAHATLVSFPLAGMLLLSWSRRRSGIDVYQRGMVVLLLLISVATCLSHALGMQRWNSFVLAYAQTLQQRQGYVSWEQAFVSVPDMYHLGSAWINPLLSLFLSEQGMVATIIDNRAPADKIAVFNPCLVSQLPATGYFDFTAYRQHLEAGVCRGQAGQFAAASSATATTSIDFASRFPAGLAASAGWQNSSSSLAKHSGWVMQGNQARLELERPLPQSFLLHLQLAAGESVAGARLSVQSGASQAQITLTAGRQQHLLALQLAAPSAAIEFVLADNSTLAAQAASANGEGEAAGLMLIELGIEPASPDSAAEIDTAAVLSPPTGDH